MLKFIHTGDIHIGTQFMSASFAIKYGNIRRIELIETFFRIIDRANTEKVDFLFISGDLFEDEYTSISTGKKIINKLNELNKTKVIIVTGNHDYYHNKSLYSILKWPKHVHIIDSFNSQKIEFKELNTVIWGCSWEEKEYKNNFNLDNIKLDNSKINILIIHGDVINVSNYLPIDKNVLVNKGFDYVALGHIHKPQFITDRIAYCGSPEPLDFKEAHEHGIIEGIISKEKINVKFLPFCLRNFIIKDIDINIGMSYLDIIEKIKNIDTEENRRKNLYRVNIHGYIDNNFHFDIDELYDKVNKQFNYIELYNYTKLDYDLDKLFNENKDNIIGMFIEKMKSKGLENKVVEKALYHGLDVLLEEKVKL